MTTPTPLGTGLVVPADHARILHSAGHKGSPSVAEATGPRGWFEQIIPLVDLSRYVAAR